MDAPRLTREDWLRAARLALLRSGVDGVRVETLARDLKVTKGSFYWHFRDLPALKEALLAEWEAESALLRRAMGDPQAVRDLIALITEQVAGSERGESPSDAAIFRWAAIDPAIAERVNRAEAERIELVRQLARTPELGDLVYMAYLGFLLRMRHAPDAEAQFATWARFATDAWGAKP